MILIMTMMIKVIKVTIMSTYIYIYKFLKFIIYLFMDNNSKKKQTQFKENRTNKYSSIQVIQLNFKEKN